MIKNLSTVTKLLSNYKYLYENFLFFSTSICKVFSSFPASFFISWHFFFKALTFDKNVFSFQMIHKTFPLLTWQCFGKNSKLSKSFMNCLFEDGQSYSVTL